jgi:hypothetical protein
MGGALRRVRAEGIERARSSARALLDEDLTPAEVAEHAVALAEEFVALDGAGALTGLLADAPE